MSAVTARPIREAAPLPGFDPERDRRIKERASQLLQNDVALRILARVLPHKARLEAISMAAKEIDGR